MGEGIVTSHFGREDGAERDGHRGVSGQVFFVFHFFMEVTGKEPGLPRVGTRSEALKPKRGDDPKNLGHQIQLKSLRVDS